MTQTVAHKLLQLVEGMLLAGCERSALTCIENFLLLDREIDEYGEIICQVTRNAGLQQSAQSLETECVIGPLRTRFINSVNTGEKASLASPAHGSQGSTD